MAEVYYDVSWFYWGCIGWADGGLRLSVMILRLYYNMYMYVKLSPGIHNEIIKFLSGHFSWIVNLSELFTYNGNWYIITLLCMVRVNWTLAWKIRSCQSDLERLTCQHALVRIDALLLQRAKEFIWRSVRRGKKQLSNQRRKSRSMLYSLWTERWVSHRDCCTRWIV